MRTNGTIELCCSQALEKGREREDVNNCDDEFWVENAVLKRQDAMGM